MALWRGVFAKRKLVTEVKTKIIFESIKNKKVWRSLIKETNQEVNRKTGTGVAATAEKLRHFPARRKS
jgi:hypothetical protein